jgi:Mor family transcriptional regulator
MYERSKIQDRIQQIEIDLAHAQDERRRARAGAPPAPRDYDPQRNPSRSNSSGGDSTRSHAWKSKVEAIKADYQQGQGLGKLALAEKYDLSPQQIRRILRNEGDQTHHPTAKLTEEQVRDILQRYQESNGRRGIIKELADTFQVRKSTICDIIARRTWRNIDIEITVQRKQSARSRRSRGAS